MQYAKKTSKPTNYLKTVHTEHLVKLQTKQAQETELLDDLRLFCKSRAAIEKEYGQSLLKLANSYHTKKCTPLLTEPKPVSEKGRTLHAVWRAQVEQTLAVANARLQSAEVMARLSEQLKPAKLARASAGKRLLDQLRSLQNDLANSTHDLSRAQKYYGEEERHAHDIRHKARNAAEKLRNRDTGIFSTMANLQKNNAKLSSRREACETRSTSARNEYLFQLAAVNAHLRHYFLVDLPALTNSLDGSVYQRIRDAFLMLCRQEVDCATQTNERFNKLALEAVLVDREFSWKIFTEQHQSFVNVIQYEFFPLVGDAVTQLRSTSKEDDSLGCIARKLARRVALRDRKMRAYQAELRAIQSSANGTEGGGGGGGGSGLERSSSIAIERAFGGSLALGGAPSSSTGSLPSSSAEEMTGYNQEYLEHKLEELEEAVRREEIEKAKMEACLDLVRDVGIDVDDLLKRAHAELAIELDSELESIYTPGSQDMSILSPDAEEALFFTARRPALGRCMEGPGRDGSDDELEGTEMDEHSEKDATSTDAALPLSTHEEEEEDEEEEEEEPLPEGDKAVAIYEYRAQRSDELDLILEEGLIILGEGDGPGWLRVRSLVDGKEGFIPASFIVLTERRERSQPDGAGEEAADHPYENWPPPPAREKSEGLRRPDTLPLACADNQRGQAGPEGRVVTAVHEYQAQSSDELSFPCGARILVLSCQANDVDDGWWRGRLLPSQQEGVFPSMMISMDDMQDLLPIDMNQAVISETPESTRAGPPAFTPPPPVVVPVTTVAIPPPALFTVTTPCTCDDSLDETPTAVGAAAETSNSKDTASSGPPSSATSTSGGTKAQVKFNPKLNVLQPTGKAAGSAGQGTNGQRALRSCVAGSKAKAAGLTVPKGASAAADGDDDEGDYEDCGGDYVRLNTGSLPPMPGMVEEEEETII